MDWKGTAVACVALVAAGIVAGGWFVGHGFAEARLANRYVTVKGLAERPVKADTALWPIRFVATSDKLPEAQAKLAGDAGKVRKFLADAGLSDSAVRVQSIGVTDQYAQPWHNGPVQSRYVLTETLAVRTGDVARIAEVSQRIGVLVQQGVALSHDGPSGGPVYIFTGLNAIKPAMIAEATRNARAGAEQFARDSGGHVGGIRQASQGVFEILPRDAAPGFDEAGQIEKTVRVVSTVRFDILD
jgi:hypothetical protein